MLCAPSDGAASNATEKTIEEILQDELIKSLPKPSTTLFIRPYATFLKSHPAGGPTRHRAFLNTSTAPAVSGRRPVGPTCNERAHGCRIRAGIQDRRRQFGNSSSADQARKSSWCAAGRSCGEPRPSWRSSRVRTASCQRCARESPCGTRCAFVKANACTLQHAERTPLRRSAGLGHRCIGDGGLAVRQDAQLRHHQARGASVPSRAPARSSHPRARLVDPRTHGSRPGSRTVALPAAPSEAPGADRPSGSASAAVGSGRGCGAARSPPPRWRRRRTRHPPGGPATLGGPLWVRPVRSAPPPHLGRGESSSGSPVR